MYNIQYSYFIDNKRNIFILDPLPPLSEYRKEIYM